MTEKIDTFCDCTPVGEAAYGDELDLPPSLAVVEAIAAAEGVEADELEPLFEKIDTDALDRLFARNDDTTQQKVLQFRVEGWNVFVRDDGDIRVCDPDRRIDVTETFQRPLVG